ncbi:hypothetical protein C8039_19860 [Halogeometricum sp. wsp3]|nr:hypothetical protein C8039_19860 [Halogeometricum sp. wsp3]
MESHRFDRYHTRAPIHVRLWAATRSECASRTRCRRLWLKGHKTIALASASASRRHTSRCHRANDHAIQSCGVTGTVPLVPTNGGLVPSATEVLSRRQLCTVKLTSAATVA